MAATNGIIEFGPFRMSRREHTLWKNGILVRLTPNEFALLLVLVEDAGNPVDPQVLLRRVWPTTHVDESSLRTTIHRLRKKLGENPSTGQDYIRNFPKRGYGLAIDIQNSRPPEPADRPVAGDASRAILTASVPSSTVDAAPDQTIPASSEIRRSRRLHAIAWCGLLFAGVAVTWIYRPSHPETGPISQITNDGRQKAGPLFTDGFRIYFSEKIGSDWIPVSMLVSGGEVTPLNIPITKAEIQDLNEHNEFLVHGVSGRHEPYLWKWRPGQKPIPLVGSGETSAGWITDGSFAEAPVGGNELRLIASDSVTPLGSVDGRPSYPRWSSTRQVLRLTVTDPKSGRNALWEVRGLAGRARLLRTYPPGACCGSWAPDGSVFLFTAEGSTGHDIWASFDNTSRLGDTSTSPIRLTDGSLDYEWPVLNSREGTILAIGRKERAEVVRYDQTTRKFEPYLDGFNGLELDFSRDGQWIVYVSYPERTLWKVRTDGSGRIRLTYPPTAPIEPHWAPDGSRIAFMGQSPGKRRRLYLLGADGGAPIESTTYPEDQGVPTWSPNGTQIVFGELRQQKAPHEMLLHLLDLRQNHFTEIPNSNGLWTARWSPNGSFIAALTEDSKKLMVFDCGKDRWRELAAFSAIESPAWTRDSMYIYFGATGPVFGPSHAATDHAVYRVHVSGQGLERLVDLKGIRATYPAWYGVAPDGSPLLSQQISTEEIYAFPLRK